MYKANRQIWERHQSSWRDKKKGDFPKIKAFLYEKLMSSGLVWLPGCHNDHIYVCAVIVPTMLRTPESEAHPNRLTLKHLLPAIKCIAAAVISFMLWLLFCGVIKLLTFGIKLKTIKFWKAEPDSHCHFHFSPKMHCFSVWV